MDTRINIEKRTFSMASESQLLISFERTGSTAALFSQDK